MISELRPLRHLTTCLLGALTCATAHAATITAVGVDATTLGAWRTTSVAKAYDGDGDNVYGSAGYLLFRFGVSTGSSSTFSTTAGTNNTLNTLPSYLGVAASPTTGPSNMYSAKALIDNPMTPGTTAASGIAYRNGGFAAAGEWANTLTFTAGAGIPTGTLRIGFLLGNSGGNDSPTAASLTSGSTTQTLVNPLTSGAQAPYWYFFDVTATAGEVFTLALQNRTAGNKPTIGGVVVDVVTVPEPTVASLGILALGALVLRRRRPIEAAACQSFPK